MRRLALAASSAALFFAASSFAGPVNLGLDPSLNLLAFGNMNASYSDVEGRVAVGGNATITGYSVNTKTGASALHGGTGLMVGGNLSFSNGSVWGGAMVGGSYTPVSSGNVIGGVSALGNAFDFTSEKTRLNQLSQTWDNLVNTGSVNDLWGTLHFSAANQTLAVFDILASDMLKNMQIDSLAPGAQVLINVHGKAVDFGNHGYTNFTKGAVIFNLVDATDIRLNGGVNASLLATGATVQQGWGQINGQVVVKDWNTSMQVNDAPLPRSTTTTTTSGGTTTVSGSNARAVPEPGSLVLAAAALLAMAMVRRARGAALRG